MADWEVDTFVPDRAAAPAAKADPWEVDNFIPDHEVETSSGANPPSLGWLKDQSHLIGSAAVNDAAAGANLIENARRPDLTGAAPFLPEGPAAFGDKYPHAGQLDISPEFTRADLYHKLGVKEYKPSDLSGRLEQEIIGGLLMPGPGRAMTRMLSAAGSGFGAEAMPEHPMIGALAGGLAPAVAGGGIQAALAQQLGKGITPETQALYARAQQMGIQPTAAQVTNNEMLKRMQAMGSKGLFAGHPEEDQQNAFNTAVARTAGVEGAEKITPEVLQQMRDQAVGTMNRVASRTPVVLDQPLMGEFQRILQEAPRSGLSQGESTAVRNTIRHIVDLGSPGGQPGALTGQMYQNLTHADQPLAQLAKTNVYGQQIRSALDDALQRSAAPEDVSALQQARKQYGAYKTIEPLTLRADTIGGATPSTGDISPAALRGRVNQQYPAAARAPIGQNDLNDLAKVGQRFLKEPSSSGTAENMIASGHGAGFGPAVNTYVFGHEAGIPHELLPLLVAGRLSAPAIAGSLARNRDLADLLVKGYQPSIQPALSGILQALEQQQRNQLSSPEGRAASNTSQ